MTLPSAGTSAHRFLPGGASVAATKPETATAVGACRNARRDSGVKVVLKNGPPETFLRDLSIPRSRLGDSRVNLADCCHNILDVRLGEFRIERDPGKAMMDCNRPGTAL